jgi:hypothetical protein
MLAVVAPVQRANGIHGIEHVADVRRRCWSSPGAETLVTEYAHAVGEFGATGRRITDCGALE